MKYRIMLLSFTLVCGSVHALNVRDALASAYKNNQELLEVRQKVIASHEKIVQAKGGFRPTIQAQAASTFIKSRTKSDADSLHRSGLQKDNKGSVTVSQNLFRGFTDVAKVSQAEHEIQSLWAQLKDKEQDVFIKVIRAYLELYAKYAAVEVHKANVVSMQKNYETASTKRSIGEETLTQESAAEAQYADAQSRLESALADLEGAKATFEQLTGTISPEYVEHPTELIDIPGSIEVLQDVALKDNPKITQAIEDLASSKQSKKAYTGQLLPSVDLQASSTRDINQNKTSINSLNYHGPNPKVTQVNNQLAVTLTVPLYDAGITRSQRRQAGENVVTSRITFEKVRKEIIQACRQVYRAYLAAKTNMDNSIKQVKAQQVAVDGNMQEMEVGTKILFDVLQAQTKLLEAKLNQIGTIQKYYENLYIMLSLQGKLTAEGLGLPVEIFHIEQNYENIKNHI
mgnify:CR=1 FL=1